MERVVLDTNQIISAGSAWVDPTLEAKTNDSQKLLKLVVREHTGLYSDGMLAEYVKKLFQRNHPRDRVATLIELLIGAFEFVDVKSKSCDPAPVDPDDVVFLVCALDGYADVLVSADRHLLDLKDAYSKPAILDVPAATQRLMSDQAA